MKLSSESVPMRWSVLLVVWVLGAVLLALHARTIGDYLTVVGSLGSRGNSVAATPLHSAYPAFAADAQTWVRHSLSLLEGHDLQLRYTTIDNAPDGREVHWNSAWAWTIAGAGRMEQWMTGGTLPEAVERATLWLAPTMLMILVVLVSGWLSRQAGTLAGVIVAIAMVGHNRIYEGFFPSYVDHHGLLTVAVFAMALGSIVMGAGWISPQENALQAILPTSRDAARRGAIFSAISGAFGLWVSAASTIPPIALVGCVSLLMVLVRGRDAERSGATFDPGLWRLWGRVGAAGSVFFYLVEYFPGHLGFRLETNHPLYALAWWGGGELIAQISEFWLGKASKPVQWARLLGAAGSILIVPAMILIGKTRFFVVIDPFLAELHKSYIQEFLPLWTALRGNGWPAFFTVVGMENTPLLVGLVLLCVLGKKCPLLVWYATLLTAGFTGMAWMQSRWLLNASGPQICLLIILVQYFTLNLRPVVRWAIAMVVVGVLFVPPAVSRVSNSRSDTTEKHVAPKDAFGMLYRDVAAALRATQPEGDIIVLASPNASTAIGYYGRFKTLGTLYWENVDGLKAAAAILSARSPEEAALLIRQHHVTHLAMISEENFIAQYYTLLHPGATDNDIKHSFGYQLMADRVVPVWLQMIPYQVPSDLTALKANVMLFKVAFGQSAPDALYNVALSKVAMGDIAHAEEDFDTLIKALPNAPQPWLRKGELLLARHNWSAAAEAMLNGIARSPAAERAAAYARAASNFYRQKQPAEAIRFYRAALAENFDPANACYLAFVLSTSPDDSVRNGSEALALAERAVKTDPNSPTFLNALAAALAEVGNFDRAVEVAERALANARVQGETAAEKVSEQRLTAYKAHKPWRE